MKTSESIVELFSFFFDDGSGGVRKSFILCKFPLGHPCVRRRNSWTTISLMTLRQSDYANRPSHVIASSVALLWSRTERTARAEWTAKNKRNTRRKKTIKEHEWNIFRAVLPPRLRRTAVIRFIKYIEPQILSLSLSLSLYLSLSLSISLRLSLQQDWMVYFTRPGFTVTQSIASFSLSLSVQLFSLTGSNGLNNIFTGFSLIWQGFT